MARSIAQLVAALCCVAIAGPALGAGKELIFPTDACAKFSCREVTHEEAALLGRVMSKLMGLLPSPDAEKYEQRGLKSAQGVGFIMVSSEMWQAANFPANVVDTMALGFAKAGAFPRSFALVYSYTLKDEGTRAKMAIGAAEHKLENGDSEYFDVRIEASAWAIAAPLESGMNAAGPDTWEKRLGGAERGTIRLALVVGPSAAKRTPPEGTPGDKLAPIKAIRLVFQGPTQEVRALASRIDRKAVKALIGPVEKVAIGE